MLAASTSFAVAIPTATVAITPASLNDGDTATVTIRFSEAVSGFSNANLSISGGMISALSTSDNITWSATFTASTGGASRPNNVIAVDMSTVKNVQGEFGAGTVNSNVYSINAGVPLITTATLAQGGVGQAYLQTIAASGGANPYTFSITSGGLPSGLALDTTNGVISGTPSAAGSFTITIRATDAVAQTATKSFTLLISAPTLVMNPTSIPNGSAYAAYSQSLSVSGGTEPYTFGTNVAGLPAGLHMSSAGLLSGTPTVAGSFTFTVQATDRTTGTGAPFTATRSYTLTISAPMIAITPGSLANGTAGQSYNAALTANGGVAPYTYSIISGALPNGMTMSSAGVLSGTATVSGIFPLTVMATDTNGMTATQAYMLTIAAPVLSIAPSTLVPATVGTSYNQTFSASGGIAPYTFTTSGGALPPGLTLNAATGVLSGAPTVAGSYGFTITATDAAHFTANAAYTMTVGDALPVAVADTATTLAGQPVTIRVVDNDTGAISAIAIDSPPSKGTAAVSGTAIIYTPANDFSGTDSFRYTATGPGGTSAPATVTVSVKARPVALSRRISVDAGTTVVVDLTEGATGGPFTAASLVSVSPSSSGTASVAARQLTFTPAFTFDGTATVVFTLSNAFAASAPTALYFDVKGRPDPSKDSEVTGLLTAQADSAKRFASNQTRNFNSRLEQLHDEGDRRRNSMAIRLGYSSDDRLEQDRQFDDLLQNDPVARSGKSSDGVPDFSVHNYAPDDKARGQGAQPQGDINLGRLAVWTGGYVNFGNRSDGNLSLDYTTAGVSAGMDYRFSKSLVAGFGVGYGRDATDVGANGTESRAHAYSGAVYASYSPLKSVFLDGLIGGSWLDFSSRRYETPTGNMAFGDRNGHQMFGSVTASYEQRSAAWLVSPYGRFDFSRSWLGSFTERGTDAYILKYGDQTVDTLAGIVGLRLEYAIPMDWGVLKPGARLEYTHDFEGSSRVSLGYADIQGLPYGYRTDDSGHDYATLGLSLDASINDSWTTNLNYRTTFGMDSQNHAFALRAGRKF